VTFTGGIERTREKTQANENMHEPISKLQTVPQAKTNVVDSAVTNMTERYAHIFSTFSLKPLFNLTMKQKMDAVQSMEKELVLANVELIEQTGSEPDKLKARIIRQHMNNLDSLTQSLPDNFEFYSELPVDKQNLLREMIFDTLTSGMDNLVDWGKTQGRLIGMTPENVEAEMAYTPKVLLN
jgi:hypothetical protein